MTEAEHKIAILALGRIFRLASRPYQEGDIEEYERCRAIIMDLSRPFDPLDVNFTRRDLMSAGFYADATP